ATFTEPNDIDNLPAVLVFSDAASNDAAIREIDAWAHAHGFLRSREYHLSTVLRDGRRFYYSACGRPYGAAEAAEDDIRQARELRDRMPMTADSAELLREEG